MRYRLFRKVDARIGEDARVALGAVVREEVERLRALPRPTFVKSYVWASYRSHSLDISRDDLPPLPIEIKCEGSVRSTTGEKVSQPTPPPIPDYISWIDAPTGGKGDDDSDSPSKLDTRPEGDPDVRESENVDAGLAWDEFFHNLAVYSIVTRLADGKMKAYAVSDNGRDLRVISRRYWRTKDGKLNIAAVADRLFAASLGEELDPHAPDTVKNFIAAPGLCEIPPQIEVGYCIFVTNGEIEKWKKKRRVALVIGGLEWGPAELQHHYDSLPPELQATMSDEALYEAAKGSGITIRQVRALRRNIRPRRGRKSKS